MMERPGAAEAVERAQAGLEEELVVCTPSLFHAEALSQVEVAGRLEITQSAVSKLEHAEDVRVSTLRDYLEALGAHGFFELVAVFEDEGRRVPVHLGKEPAARIRSLGILRQQARWSSVVGPPPHDRAPGWSA
ncbi:MAG: XRE family transcriptional regulator [Acidimicrobiales bacterium]